MNEADKKSWIYRTTFECDDALREIAAAKKEATSAFDRRTRILEQFKDAIWVKAKDEGQLDLFEPAASISAEVRDLLNDPLAGL